MNKGLLLVNKPKGQTSFSLIAKLRKRLTEKRIGHAGTLDPFATGVMVILISRNYTKLSDQLMAQDKEYKGRIKLGITTDSFDIDGQTITTNAYQPSIEELKTALKQFQGTIEQIPPMFSAKKVKGKKLYELARKGISIERTPKKVWVECHLDGYDYPYIDITVTCSKGTYIRSIAHDLGQILGCGAHLVSLTRTRSGSFKLEDCIDGSLLEDQHFDPTPYISTL